MKGELPVHSPFRSSGTVRAAITAAARLSGVSSEEIIGRAKVTHAAHLRFAVIIAVRSRKSPPSFPMIGRMLGGRDHSTIYNGLRRGRELVRNDDEFAAFVLQLIDEVSATVEVSSADRARVSALLDRLSDAEQVRAPP